MRDVHVVIVFLKGVSGLNIRYICVWRIYVCAELYEKVRVEVCIRTNDVVYICSCMYVYADVELCVHDVYSIVEKWVWTYV